VGFPGESDADFEATMRLVRDIGFAQAYSFKYSARPGTPAAEMDDQIPENVKSERLAALQALLAQQQKNFNAAMTGRSLPVLLERPGRHPGQFVGRSPYMQAVHLEQRPEGDLEIGQIVAVEILSAEPHSLRGSAMGGAQRDA